MVVPIHRPADTAQAHAHAARHPFLQREKRLRPPLLRKLLDTAEHRHRTAGRHDIERRAVLPHRIEHRAMGAGTSIVRRDQDPVRGLPELLQQKEIRAAVPEYRRHLFCRSALPGEPCSQLQHRRNADAAAEQEHSLSTEAGQIIAVAESAEDPHRTAGRLCRQLQRPASCGPIHDDEVSSPRILPAQADRSWKQCGRVIRINAEELSWHHRPKAIPFRRMEHRPVNPVRQLLRPADCHQNHFLHAVFTLSCYFIAASLFSLPDAPPLPSSHFPAGPLCRCRPVIFLPGRPAAVPTVCSGPDGHYSSALSLS